MAHLRSRGTSTVLSVPQPPGVGTAEGLALWVLCNIVLPDSEISEPGGWVLFWHSLVAHFAPHAEHQSGPSPEQTLSSGHLPFEHSTKARGFQGLKSCFKFGLLVNKN